MIASSRPQWADPQLRQPLTTAPPPVSVIMPVRNERSFVYDALASLVRQDYSNIVEILVVDGGSSDGTQGLVEGFGPPVRLMANQRRSAAAALNIGLAAAAGEIVVRADGHTIYAEDYVRRCVDALGSSGAANVGGRMDPVGITRFGRAVALATSTPIGVGPGKFHYEREQQVVDTVYLGCWTKATLEALGGFDDKSLQWGSEDQELNLRLRQCGGKVLLDPAIRSWYIPRSSPKALWRQYFNYGLCKASTLRKHRRFSNKRSLAPAALVAITVFCLVGRGRHRRYAVPAIHAATCGLFAVSAQRRSHVRTTDMFVVLEICHWAHGLGFWVGASRWLFRRAFDNCPRV